MVLGQRADTVLGVVCAAIALSLCVLVSGVSILSVHRWSLVLVIQLAFRALSTAQQQRIAAGFIPFWNKQEEPFVSSLIFIFSSSLA